MRQLSFRLLTLVPLVVAACGDDTGGQDGGSGGSGDEQPTPVPTPVVAPPEEPKACESLDPDSPVVLYLSSDDSNSMASPARVREALASGGLPSDVRTYEFLNYYRFDFGPSPAQGVLGSHLQARAGEEPGEIALLVGVQSAAAASRRPMTLTFVVDDSGSMRGPGIQRARAAMRALASQLRAGDVVNVVTWNTEQNVLLDNHAVQGADDPALIAVADGLDAEGGTDLNAGLVRGYALATQTFAPERLNRLILISDGGANVGVTNAELIAQHSGLNDDEGIYLVGIGTGPVQSYTDALMDTVTDAGRGAYVYLDSIEEADRILRDRFDEVMEVAARGVQIELTLPWYYRMHRFYGEEYSKDPKEVKPQHLAPGDTMVLLQTLQACDASLVSDKDPVRVRVRWNEPISHLQREVASETTLGALALGGAAQLHKAQAIVAAAEALKDPSTEAMIEARASIERADPEGQDDDLLELEELLNRMD